MARQNDAIQKAARNQRHTSHVFIRISGHETCQQKGAKRIVGFEKCRIWIHRESYFFRFFFPTRCFFERGKKPDEFCDLNVFFQDHDPWDPFGGDQISFANVAGKFEGFPRIVVHCLGMIPVFVKNTEKFLWTQ